MIPVLSHIETKNDLNFWITTDGVVGTGFHLEGVDLETTNLCDHLRGLKAALKSIDPRVLTRIRLEVRTGIESLSEFPRGAAISNLGYKEVNLFVFFDYLGGFDLLKEFVLKTKNKHLNSHQEEVLNSSIKNFKEQGFRLSPLSIDEVNNFFIKDSTHWRTSLKAIETGKELIGVLRLEKMPFKSFEILDWVETLKSLPSPYALNISFQRLDEASSKIFLEKRRKQSDSGNDVSSKLQRDATIESIKENFETGSKLFTCEVLIELKRLSEEKLSQSLNEAGNRLQTFSDTYLETFGVAPSFCATLPGSDQHVTFLESEEGLSGLLPLLQRREVGEFISPQRSLTLFRSDESLYHFDLFNPEFNAFNTLIVGTSGKGKSVLTGLLTQSLLHDPNVCIIKLDVGGSHSKECELFGGIEYQLSLDKPSGINIFSALESRVKVQRAGTEVASEMAAQNDQVAILSKFLESLIREQGEVVLSKSLRSEIESAVRVYAESSPQDPSLDDFYDFTPNFPRRDLLKRWVKGGLYSLAFASPKGGSVESLRESRLRYYNFSQIFQAADPEFAQAGIAAVLAQFNIEMLKANGKRLVLICDETPFFVKTCFDFFKFSTANVRKYGHAVVLIGQLSTDFIVGGDSGIIENSPQRFLFSVDGDEVSYKERFNLSQEKVDHIKQLRSVPGKFSEALLQTGDAARVVNIKVTPEEYWRLTTSKVDREKLMNLVQAVPGLTLREAINCLSMER